jgi:uncharacterized membrane protein
MDLTKKSFLVKSAITLVSMGLAYVLISHIATPLFVHDPAGPLHGIFPQDPGSAAMSIFIVSLFLSLAVGLLVANELGLATGLGKAAEAIPIGRAKKSTEADLQVLKKMMSDDEKKLVEEIEKSGEITQDSLRLRLDWSKAKTSTVLSLLDRQGIIQKERSGKTYRVRLDPSVSPKRKTV